MKTNAGLWIDHREAVIVVLSETGEETKRIPSTVEKQMRRSGEPDHGPFEAQQAPADDSRERQYNGHLAHYYDEIIAYLRDAGEIVIFGPGEAKGELKKRLEHHKGETRTIEVETADKMTEAQIVAKVRHHFYTEAVRRGTLQDKQETRDNLMKTPKPCSEQKSCITEKAEHSHDSLTDPAMIEFASVLDDFLDEEVVDKQGIAIGTLACYWGSVSGHLMFLGVKLKGQESVRIVPGRPSQVDNRNTCIRLGFAAEDIKSAPYFDCGNELDAKFEYSVYKHFRMGEPKPHDGLRYFTRNRERSLQFAASSGVEETN